MKNLFQLPIYYDVPETTKLFRHVKHITTLIDQSSYVERNLCREFSAHRYNFSFYVREETTTVMAQFKQSTFANLTLSRDDEKKFTAWEKENKPTAESIMGELLGAGFKISISWVVDSNAFCLSIIGTEHTKQHRNMVMTTWSDDLAEVILLAGYKHFVVCGGGEWPSTNSGERWG